MALKYQSSEIAQFILSDLDRQLLPVRITTDTSTPGQLSLNLGYFDESWTVTFEDIGDQPPKTVIGNTNLVDLFDLFMIQNEIPSFRESDLHNCLVLIKDFYSIVSSGRDVSCWRSISDNPPKVDGHYCLGQFEGNKLISCQLVEWGSGQWLLEEQHIGVGPYTHWFNDISKLFYINRLLNEH